MMTEEEIQAAIDLMKERAANCAAASKAATIAHNAGIHWGEQRGLESAARILEKALADAKGKAKKS